MKGVLRLLQNPWVVRVYVVLVLSLATMYLYSQRIRLGEALLTMDICIVWIAILIHLGVVGLLCSYVCYTVLRRLGGHLSFGQAFSIYHL